MIAPANQTASIRVVVGIIDGSYVTSMFPDLRSTEGPSGRTVLADSITDMSGGAELVASGSHAGLSSAAFALTANVTGVVFNDAGIGRDGAGIAGLSVLDRFGIPAGAVSHETARVGIALDTLHSVVAHLNETAKRLGCRLGESTRTTLMRMGDNEVQNRSTHERASDARLEGRSVIESDGLRVVLLNSASAVHESDSRAIVVTGSHGGMVGGSDGRALKHRVLAAVFNDAGGGRDNAGWSRLNALDDFGIPAVAVSHWSACIGDARSTHDDGVISRLNRTARAMKALEGDSVQQFVDLVHKSLNGGQRPAKVAANWYETAGPPLRESASVDARGNIPAEPAEGTSLSDSRLVRKVSEPVGHTQTDLPPGVNHLELYRRMYLARRFDERNIDMLVGRQYPGFEGPFHPSIGQEAVAVGVCANLSPQDRITSNHRGHAHTIAKGGDLGRMMAELFGREAGYCRGRGGSMHIAEFGIGMLGANGIVAAGLPIATGAALASKLEGQGNVTVCFFSEGAAAAGPLHETMNIAALWKLPMIFLCENNGWASGVPASLSLAPSNPSRLAPSYGIVSDLVDGNDVEAVLSATKHAIEYVRAGRGPYFLEALTYRMSAHALRSELPRDVRDAKLHAEWVLRDPLRVYGNRLVERGAASELGLKAVHQAVEAQLDDAVQFALASPFPLPEQALEGLFAS